MINGIKIVFGMAEVGRWICKLDEENCCLNDHDQLNSWNIDGGKREPEEGKHTGVTIGVPSLCWLLNIHILNLITVSTGSPINNAH